MSMTGKSAGSGKYSFHERHFGKNSVMAAHMPEDLGTVRVAFRDHGDAKGPVWLLSEREGEMLWAVLCSMAKDLNWEDYK